MESKAQVRKVTGAGAAALFFFVLQQTVFAGLAVSPITQHLEVKPGKTTTFTIHITNNVRGTSAQTSRATIEILDFKVSDTGILSFGPEYKHERSASKWITLDVNQIVLMPGESKEIKGTVNAPMNADGDYWASAMVSFGESKEDDKGVQVKLRTATGLFIRVVRRTNIERGNITDVNIMMPTFETGPVKKELSEIDQYQINEKQSLKIKAKIKNEGLIAIPAKGKAFIYNENMKKIATIPLYVSRNNVLPGDSRWFTGIMSQPLPGGEYKIRVMFSSEKSKRQLMKESNFTITGDLANVWAKNTGNDNNITKLEFTPEKIDLKLNPGRATTANVQVKNAGLNTIAANCKIEKSENDWLELKTTDFTLSPNGSTSMPCSIKVPADAKPGAYKWSVIIEMEQSGLESTAKSQTVQYSVPITVTIE
jgi:uncharacterized membrane protein